MNSEGVVQDSRCGLPLIGQWTSTPRLSSQGRLSQHAWARHNPTETAEGAFNVMTMPIRHRLYTPIRQGTDHPRPMPSLRPHILRHGQQRRFLLIPVGYPPSAPVPDLTRKSLGVALFRR